jgi:hypothetical protein
MVSRLIRANHSKGWGAKLLAYIQEALDTVAELPGTHSLCGSGVARAATQEENMTIQKFIDALKVTRANGYYPYLVTQSSRQMIRLKSPTGVEHCPITAVCERYTGQTCPPMAIYSLMESLGLHPDDAYTIAAAADGDGSVPLVRQQLLTALAPLESVAPSER